jgi:MFS transporter, AAHS family, benzoate transport protein
MTGYNDGAVLCALIGMLLVPLLGWRAIFIVGALPAFVLVATFMGIMLIYGLNTWLPQIMHTPGTASVTRSGS